MGGAAQDFDLGAFVVQLVLSDAVLKRISARAVGAPASFGGGRRTRGGYKPEYEPEFFTDGDGARSLALGGIQLCRIHGHMDCKRPVERRDRGVRHGVRLADHKPRRESDDRVPGPGGRQLPPVPLHPACGRLGGRDRFASAADRRRTRDSGGLRDIRWPGVAGPRDAGAPAGDDNSCWAWAARSPRPHGGRRLRSSCPRRTSTARRP
jgi:hypothetical protein